ncbi:hypothetical protein [Bdellovibrio sp. HCB337]|uniref:hypothetical protein n=1 Tax=Bdellovibrio sp. HCB337 TaxID=3394358 RepID=UPI0039A57F3F
MAQNIFKRPLTGVVTSFLLISFLAACGNVRFTASSSTDGTGTTSGTGGNNPGDDGNIAGNDGGGRDDGDDGAIPGGGGTPGSTPTPTPPPSGPRTVDYNLTVPAHKNQVDFLLVIDNSASMIAVQQKMAQSMTALAARMNELQIDWQMCLTVTTDMNKGGTATGTGTHNCRGGYCTGAYSGGSWHWGVSLPWSNNQTVLTKAALASNGQIFNNTIPLLGAGDSGTGDERGVKAAYNHFANWKSSGANNTTGCYRQGSSVAVILLSDEDERSVAGNCSRVNTALGDKEIPACRNYNDGSIRVLEFQDMPSNLVSQANSVFGDTARFTFNSIISESEACTKQLNENASFIKDGVPYYSPHYTGTVYAEASRLTNGKVASLCSQDLQLNLFSDVVVNKLDKLSLECEPVAGSLKVDIGGAPTNSFSVSGAVVTFNPALSQGQVVHLNYKCSQ